MRMHSRKKPEITWSRENSWITCHFTPLFPPPFNPLPIFAPLSPFPEPFPLPGPSYPYLLHKAPLSQFESFRFAPPIPEWLTRGLRPSPNGALWTNKVLVWTGLIYPWSRLTNYLCGNQYLMYTKESKS